MVLERLVGAHQYANTRLLRHLYDRPLYRLVHSVNDFAYKPVGSSPPSTLLIQKKRSESSPYEHLP